MRKLIGVVFVLGLGACHRGNPNPPLPSGTEVGAIDPAGVAAAVFAAGKSGDVQALSVVWGDTLGVERDRMDRTQLEQRGAIMLLCLRNDRYTLVSDAPGQMGSRVLTVQVTRNGLTRSTKLVVVKGPRNRWYFNNDETLMKDLEDICKQPQK